MSLRKRIQILLALLVAAPLLLLLYESYQTSRRALILELKEDALQTARLEAAEIDYIFAPAQIVAEATVRSIESLPTLDPDRIRELLRRTLHESPGVYGLAIALDPELTPLQRFAPYVFRPAGRETETELHYDYAEKNWYRLPRTSGAGHWIRPYYGEGGKALMVSYAVPVRRDGRVVGVVATDLDIATVVTSLRALRPGGTGSVYVVHHPPGTIVAHPAVEVVTELPPSQEMVDMATLIQRRGVDTVEMTDPVSKRRSWIVESPIRTLTREDGTGGWSVIVSWPLDDRLAPLNQMAQRMLVLYIFLGGAALWFLNRTIDDTITRPLRRLAEQARQYAAGNFVEPTRVDREASELQELGAALNALGEALRSGERAAQPPEGEAP